MPRASEKERSNNGLCLDFAMLLTANFAPTDSEGKPLEGEALALCMAQTKQWRGAMWKMFMEIEARMCPRPELAKRPDYAAIAKATLSSRSAGARQEVSKEQSEPADPVQG